MQPNGTAEPGVTEGSALQCSSRLQAGAPEVLEGIAGLVHVLSGDNGYVGGVEGGAPPALVAHEACADERHCAIAITQPHTTLLPHLQTLST